MKKEDVKMRPGGFNENKTYAAKKKPEESNNGRKWRNKKLTGEQNKFARQQGGQPRMRCTGSKTESNSYERNRSNNEFFERC